MKKKNKIFFVTECPYSGVLKTIIEHAKMFREMGFDSLFFILPEMPRDRYGETLSENIILLSDFGKVLRFPLRRFYRAIINDKKYLYDFFLKQDGDYTVLSYSGYAGKVCRLLYKKGVIQRLYHVPQCVDIIRRPFFQKITEFFFERWLSDSASFFLACGPGESYSLTNHFHVNKNKIILAPNFVVQTDNDHKKKINKEFDFIILGRVSKDKRIGDVLAAAELVGLLDRFTIVGGGSELELLKNKYPAAHFLGRVSNLQAQDLLTKSRYFVSASIIEGLSYSMIESMNCGVVPIVSDVSGHSDLIIDGYNGFLFTNQKQLVNILFKSHACLSKSKYFELSTNAKETVKKAASYSMNIFENHFLSYE